MLRRVLPLAVLIACFASVTCGSSSAAAPTPLVRARVSVSLDNVSVEGTRLVPTYKFQTRLQESGGVPATVTSIVVSFMNGSTTFTTLTATTDLPSNQVPANGTASANWEIQDAGHPIATRIEVSVTFTDGAGSQSATGSGDVPPLIQGPTIFSVTGTVREQGAGTIAEAQVLVTGTSQSSTTDSQGRYSLSGLSAGSLTLRASRNGYNTLEQAVNVTGNTVADLTMTRATPPPSVPPPTIDNFFVDLVVLVIGQSTTLRWMVSNATSCSIDNGIGNVSCVGARTIAPTVQSTTYRLSATSGGGSANRSVTVSVPDSMFCSNAGLASNVTAICNSGQSSMSQNRSGTCSSNGGVRCWVCPGILCF